jgi:hypothetical protein
MATSNGNLKGIERCKDGCPFCDRLRLQPCPCACHFATLADLERERVADSEDIGLVRVALDDALEARDEAMAAASQHEKTLREVLSGEEED